MLTLLTAATLAFTPIGKPVGELSSVRMVVPEPFLQYPGMALPPFLPASAFPPMYGASDELVGVMELSLLGGIFAAYYLSANVKSMYHLGTHVKASLDYIAAQPDLSPPEPVEAASGIEHTLPSGMQWLAGGKLPSIEELMDGCYLVAESAWHPAQEDQSFFLCATPSDDHCQPDEDFSAYYDQPVYLCPA